MKRFATPLLVLFLLAAGSASAQVQMLTVSAPSSVANPISSGININYTMTGSKVGLASAQVTFYMSATPDGSSGVYELDSFQILLNLNTHGTYSPPSGTQTRYISASGLSSGVYALWQNITTACLPSTWYVLGRVDYTSVVSSSASVMGTTKQPDFYFTGGSMTPGTISSGGTVYLSFDVHTQCPASSASVVGIYLADTSFNLLAHIGDVNVSAGAGTSSLPPTPITFTSIPPGNYIILLFADADDVVAESDESNNVGGFYLTVASSLRARADEVGEEKLNVELPVKLSPALHAPRMGEAADYIIQAPF